MSVDGKALAPNKMKAFAHSNFWMPGPDSGFQPYIPCTLWAAGGPDQVLVHTYKLKME
jgi:hypothetical protein